MSWHTIPLGEVMDVKHGFAFKSEHYSDRGELILLTPGNCKEAGGLKLKGDKEKYYVGEYPSEYLLSEGDMLVVMTDLINTAPILGGSFIIPENNKYLHNQRLGLVEITDARRIDKTFLYYLLNTHNYRGQVRGSASGATVRHTSPGRIKGCLVSVPRDVSYQHKIGAVLSTYDELIENNRRRMVLLEESARLLYREWFVSFRFPGHEHMRIVDGVPEGWEKKKIQDVCVSVGGGTPSTKNLAYWDGGEITWVVPTDITRNDSLVLLDSEKKITDMGLRESSAKMLPPETILMTSRASVGFFGLIDKEVCTNQGFISVIPNEDHHRMFLLYNLMSRRDEILNNAGGTTYKEISKSTFRNFEILLPTNTLLKHFQDFAYEAVRQVRLLKKQNQRLQQARDLLLPRLISGQISI